VITRGVSTLSQAQSGFVSGLLGAPLAVMVAAVALTVNALAFARPSGPVWPFSSGERPDSPEAGPAAGPVDGRVAGPVDGRVAGPVDRRSN
jgi:hypothetical protein